jgi:hypothetical protein
VDHDDYGIMTQTPQELLMKLVTISMQLVIDDEDVGSDYDNIAQYLTDKLYTDPEFFGDFGSENILEIKEFV